MNPQDYQPPVNPSQPQGQQQGGQSDTQPQLVFVSRPHEPVKPEMSPEIRRKHEESKVRYPHLNLSEGEFIISAVDRHPFGLLQIWSIVGILLAILLAAPAAFAFGAFQSEFGGSSFPIAIVAVPALLLSVLVLLFGFVETSIYTANKFFLTNESVIQIIQTGLFSKREQTVSLANIEDASYTQHGLVQSMFNFGMIRLSTEGDETTYRFSYASDPKRQIAILNNAVEAFKNGRPVTGDN